jgi:hypothetical protein
VEFSDLFIDMTVAKKWKLFRDRGVQIDAEPGECMVRAVTGLFGPAIVMSPWTREMLQDFAREDKYAMIGCGACGKSFAMAACGITYWLTDPFDTAVVVGSATLKDLATRAWAPTVSLFTALKNNKDGIPIPGHIVTNQYAIVNERDAAQAASMSVKAAIQGRALEEGRIQGLHAAFVLLMVDELALVRDIEALKESITNIRIGTLGAKVMSAANPDPWDSPNSCFYLPQKGEKVDVNTGSWRSAMGYFVRHFDGLKSPVVRDQKLKDIYPFLMSQEDVDEALMLSNGDLDHVRMWKMIRGFPLSQGTGAPTVLDPMVASAHRVVHPLDPPMSGTKRHIGLAAGCDPAWTANGDAAIYSGVEVVEQDGRPILDFSGRTSRLSITASSKDPVTFQLRNGVIARMQNDGGPSMTRLYVDSSGNQGLADDLDIYVGPGCGHVNASNRASDNPIRAMDPEPACKRVKDRGTEAWVVLAEFCRAGQVRGLPQGALDGLVQRRFAVKPGSNVPVTPLRLENKEDFIRRFRGSPNETDTCALAALAVKERMGIIPYGATPAPRPDAIIPGAYPQTSEVVQTPDAEYGSADCDEIGLYAGD